MKSVYIVLTKTSTALSKIIGVVTSEAYTHAAISMDNHFDSLYTFSRLQPESPLPAGFTIESLYSGYMALHPDTACEVYELTVTDFAYNKMKQKIARMEGSAETYRYSILGTIYCMLSIKHKRPHHYFCSQFIGELLRESGAATLPKHESLMHPIDYCLMPECRLIYHGNLHGLTTYYIRQIDTAKNSASESSSQISFRKFA